MTKTGQDVGVSSPIFTGDSVTLELTVEETDGSSKDLTGATVTFKVIDKSGNTIIDQDTSGVNVSVVDTTNGRVDISIPNTVTDDNEGRHNYRVRVEDSSGDIDTVTMGKLHIQG